MRNPLDKVHDPSQDVLILNFEAKHANEILDIQTECGLSVWTKNDYLGELERTDSIFKIAQTTDGKVIGFALAHLTIGNTNFDNTSFDSSEILNIAVRLSFQHRGIGQIILDEIVCKFESKKISEIWLEVRKSNVDAINFYRKNNFEMQFERKNYYSNPAENACILRRLIKAETNQSEK